jgi:SecD/SecF fusion protein
MRRNNLWKFSLIVFLVAWSIYEMYPPVSRDLLLEFQIRSFKRDATFSNIVERAKALEKEKPNRSFGNLKDAVGTNDLSSYFPNIDVKGEKDPNSFILNWVQQRAAGRIKLGLDLQGGSSFLVKMDTSKLGTNAASIAEMKTVALSHAVEVLRRRVDKLGVAEPLIQPAGVDSILIQLPGITEDKKDEARRNIQKAAYLELRLVHEHSEELVKQGLIEPGYEVLKEQRTLPDGHKELVSYLVSKKAELTGEHVKSAGMSREQFSGKPEVVFSLDAEGARIFADVTKKNIKRQLAIVLDGELQSAPVIESEIPTGNGVIHGDYDEKTAAELSQVLENPLKAPVHIESERDVDPSLGRDSIKSGIVASLVGTVAVAAFMAVYYLFAGVVANLALSLNIIILFGVMCSVGTTLTLPGIAGIVLTIGMAVDANVLIFERIREEIAAGKSMRGALSAGYDKAFSTIFDSNLTTLISSVILIFMGTGPVKGFGVTLTIGLLVSMFTALVVTRLIFDWLLSKDWLKKMTMLHIIRGAKFDFMGLAKPAFAASWLLIIVGMGYGIFVRGQNVLGVDFSGGDGLTLSFSEKAEVDKVRETVTKAGKRDPLIQYQKNVGAATETLRITTAFNAGEAVEAALKKDFPKSNFKVIGTERVGASVGREIQKTAVLASLFAMAGILVYVAFRYELSFAVGAVIAIMHDILMTMGWFFLTGREMNAPIVAAILTIIGFSINDTIVIFDRIREDLKLGIKGTFREVMNQALNQTLSRTIITSGTVFLATLALYLFGGGVINDFAFTFMVGIITGTYSSIYIASAIVLWWHKGERPMTGSKVIMENTVTARA